MAVLGLAVRGGIGHAAIMSPETDAGESRQGVSGEERRSPRWPWRGLDVIVTERCGVCEKLRQGFPADEPEGEGGPAATSHQFLLVQRSVRARQDDVAVATPLEGRRLCGQTDIGEHVASGPDDPLSPGQRGRVGQVRHDDAVSVQDAQDVGEELDGDQVSRMTTSAKSSRMAAIPERPSTGRTLIPERGGSGALSRTSSVSSVSGSQTICGLVGRVNATYRARHIPAPPT